MATEQSLTPSKKTAAKGQFQSLDAEENHQAIGSTSKNQRAEPKEMQQALLSTTSKSSKNSSLEVNATVRNPSGSEAELGELAKFARENRIQLSEMLQGAKISETLKRYGSDPTHFARFVESVYTRASEKGHTPTEILAQCEKINSLEQKYGTSFDNLKIRFERVGKELVAKSKESKALEQEVSSLQAKRAKMLEQHSMDEKKLKEYSEVKDQLASMNFDIKSLVSLRNCLLALKEERFDAKEILEKLQVIGLLEPRKRALQAEITKQKEEVEKNKALLAQLKRAHDTGLSLDQIDGIRQVVAQISASRGVPARDAFNLFEQDVLKNYDASLGLIPEIARLNDEKQKILSEIEAKKSDLESRERAHLDKINKLEQRYAAYKAEISAFNNLREMGIDGAKILRFEKHLGEAALDFPVIESQLAKYKSLKELEDQEAKKVRELQNTQASLSKSIEVLASDKRNLEESVRLLKDSAITEIESAKSKALSSLSELNEKLLTNVERVTAQIVSQNERTLQDVARSSQQGIKGAMDESKAELMRAVSEASNSVSSFSTELKKTIKDSEDELKVVSQTLEAGEKIGKYEAILPLLEIMSGDSNSVQEAEALIAMWNVSSRFNMWLSSRYGDQKKKEIAEPLSNLVKAMSDEIQRVDG
ncbi:MAG TPA: hypothetical protein VFF30_15605 [Nitrososphaerales archaeon]|nr:hypothetical protein [Nitrososphaerales archaeon]